MAVQIWLGNASLTSLVMSLTVGGTPATSQTYSVTIGFGTGKTVTYVASGTDTNATIATALQALLAACLFPEFREILWSNPSAGVIYATAVTAGVPFTLTTAASGTGTLTAATVTANSGPSDASLAANWSGGLPVTGDQLYFQASNVPCLYNLQFFAGITPALVQVDASFTASIGLPVNNPNGYREYRQRFLQFNGAIAISIGQGQGSGSGKIQLDLPGGDFSASVWKSAASTEPGMPAVQFKGGGNNSSVNVLKGTVGISLLAGETAHVPTLTIDYVGNQNSDAQVWAGGGCTLANVTMSGGQLTALCPVPSLVSGGGNATVLTGNMTTATLNYAGQTAPPSILKYAPTSASTITTYSIGKNAVLDVSGTLAQVTGTNGTVYAGGAINAPAGNFVMTNAASVPDGQASDVTLNLGINRHLQVS